MTAIDTNTTVANRATDPPGWLQIDLRQLGANVRWWRQIAQPAGDAHPPLLGAVVKANAYGLGAVPISRHLVRCGVDMLLVYSLQQAMELVDAGIEHPTLVFLPTTQLPASPALRRAAANGQLHFSVDDPHQAGQLDQVGCALGCRLPIHVHLDTGMSRAGVSAAQFAQMLRDSPQLPGVRLAGIYTHLATAPTDVHFVDQQVDRLDRALDEHKEHIPNDVLIHLSSTFAACRSQRYHRHLMRIGLGLYGYGPELIADPILPHDGLPRPIVRWLSRIVHVADYPTGATVSYERTCRLGRNSRLGIVPAGYGDGYATALQNKSHVRLLDEDDSPLGNAPVLGQINMDQLVVDLTDVPAATLGTKLELLSADPDSVCSAPRLAKLASTHVYDILCRLSPRLPRVYIDA